jgi:hypothetical protein
MIAAVNGNSFQFHEKKVVQAQSNIDLRPTAVLPPTETVTLRFQNKLNDLGKKYDVTNISNHDLAQLSMELRDGGFLSAFDAANLSIVIVPLGQSINPDATSNVLKSFQAQLNFAEPGSSTARSVENILEVLTNLSDNYA